MEKERGIVSFIGVGVDCFGKFQVSLEGAMIDVPRPSQNVLWSSDSYAFFSKEEHSFMPCFVNNSHSVKSKNHQSFDQGKRRRNHGELTGQLGKFVHYEINDFCLTAGPVSRYLRF